jgi:hypothetical protein
MNRSQVASISLLGWYLMVPPLEHYGDRWTPDVDKPLSSWHVDHAFDTAAKCEAGKIALQDSNMASSNAVPWNNPSKQSVMARSFASLASQCIESTDPRLAR